MDSLSFTTNHRIRQIHKPWTKKHQMIDQSIKCSCFLAPRDHHGRPALSVSQRLFLPRRPPPLVSCRNAQYHLGSSLVPLVCCVLEQPRETEKVVEGSRATRKTKNQLERQRILSRFEPLENGRTMVTCIQPATQKPFCIKIVRTTTANAEVLKKQFHAEIQASAGSNTQILDTLPTEIRTEIQTGTASNTYYLQTLRTQIDSMKASDAEAMNTFRTEIETTEDTFRIEINASNTSNAANIE